MIRMNLALFAVIAFGIGLLTAPQFMVGLLIAAGVIMFGLRWFARSAGRGWRR
ncbi:hypothetical protein [Nocardia tengchongensis]